MRRGGLISSCAVGVLLSTLVARAAGESLRTPVAISPGAPDATLTIGAVCPTFSWAGVAAAQGYELEVAATDEHGAADVALAARFAAGALSWTPPLDRCLQPGKRYAWKLRSVVDGIATAWSGAAHFQVSRHPSPAEVAMAYDILRRHQAAMPRSVTDARKTSGSGTQAAAQAPRPDAARGAASGLGVEGRVEALDIDVVEAFASGAGQIFADGDIDARNAAIASQQLTLSALGALPVAALASFRSPADGFVVLCEAGTTCETGAAGNRARLNVERLFAYGGLDVGSGGLVVASGSTPTGSGGSGFFEVPSATFTRVDDNASECPTGSIMVGVRLAETDADQIGVQALCTTP